MATNKFDIRLVVTHGEEDLNPVYGEILEGFTVTQLPKINELVNKLNQNLRLCIFGDIDVHAVINKKNNFDDSFFPWLIICGSFHCSKYSKNFPRIVSETFDCSNLGKDYVTKGMFLPLTHEINCAYSITDFDVLMGILPETLETLVVEPKLIKKNFLLKDHEHRLKTLTFIDMYPNLTILDTNGNNLLNVLQEIDKDFENKKLESEAKKIEQITSVIQETFEIKINGKHMDVKEILAYCRTLPEYNSYSDDALERLIRNVLSDQRQNGIQKKIMRRADGVNVVCIESSQRELVHTDLQKLIKERETEKIKEATVSFEKQEIIKPRTVVLKPIKIKKYIKTGQLKEIKKSSGEQNANAALRIINEINLDPLEMQFQGPVHIIKDGRETVSATVKKESGCCLVQSIDSSNHDDTKRLVWGVADGPDGLILVCVGFREHHNTKKASNMYEDLRSMVYKKQTYTAQDLSEYIEIGSIIDNGNSGNGSNGDKGDFSLPKNDILSNKLADILGHKY